MESLFSGLSFRDSGSGMELQDHDPGEHLRSHNIYSSMRLGEAQIRLLQLLPGRHPDTIRCTLSNVEIPDSDSEQTGRNPTATKTAYEALSYVWASDEDDVVIFVNHTPIRISANLFLALECLRLPDRIRLLWVDAICVNQEDTREKSEQVRIMDRIYSSAETVLIYLGPDADGSSLVMDYLSVDDFELLDDDGILFTEASARMSRAQGRSLHLSLECERVFLAKYFTSRGLEEKRILQAAYAFFCRPWWYHMWVIQEAKLAKRDPVWLCGRQSTSTQRMRERLPALHNFTLQKLQPAFLSIEEALKVDHHGRRKPDERLMAWCRGVECLFFTVDPEYVDIDRQSLSVWLDRCTVRQSTDPRDRIFALVSMLDPFARGALAPDYSKSSEQVFSLATAYVLLYEGSTRVFAIYGFTRAQRSHSWSLDFTIPLPVVVPHALFSQYDSAYWYAKPVRAKWVDRKLILSGIDFDSIREASNIDEDASNFHILQAIRTRQKMFARYGRSLVRQRLTPPEDLTVFILNPSYKRETKFDTNTTALQDLDVDYLRILQGIAPFDNEFPGATRFCCQMLKAVAAHVSHFADVRCEYIQQQQDLASKEKQHRAYLKTALIPMTREFLDAATFELSELKSVINGLGISQIETGPSTPSPTMSMTFDYGQLEAAFDAAQSPEELDTMKSLAQDAAETCHSIVLAHTQSGTCSREADIDKARQELTLTYSEAKASLREINASCTCGDSKQEAHKVELEARHHVIFQEELMFEHVVKFLKQRREAEYFSVENLAFERQNKSIFITEARLFGVSFQHDPGVEEGDKLVLMNGFRTPMILSKIKGAAYVAGVCDVDFESLILDGVLQEEQFEII